MREQALGVVDIGSNTVHLLVARTNGRSLTPIVDISEGLGLGLEVDYGGTIGPQKLDDLLVTLGQFQASANDAGVKNLHLLATQAVRMAANRDAVCAAITARTNLPVDMLTPEQEAMLAYVGADASCPGMGPRVVVDIGGASMQIAIGQDGELWDSVSLPLGAARVSSHFVPTDPPHYLEEATLVTYLASVIPPALPLPDSSVTGVLGTGGTLRRTPQILGYKPGEQLEPDALERVLASVRGRSSLVLSEEYDLKPERARLLMPAAIVLREVMRGYEFPPLIMAPYGVREGAILSLARLSVSSPLNEVA